MRVTCATIIVLLLITFGIACQGDNKTESQQINPVEKTLSDTTDHCLKVTSKAFIHEGMIPVRYTCDGDNIAPEISWRHIPDEVKSFAMICDDPDAPSGTWIHWVVFNIPAEDSCLSIAMIEENNVCLSGNNSWNTLGYGGPCPPSGTHRYFFKVYALDVILEVKEGLTKAELLDAMQGHILTSGEIMGKYQRQS